MTDQSSPPQSSPNSSTLRDQLQLSLLPGLGPRSLTVLIESFGHASAVLKATKDDLQRVPGIGPKLAHTIATAHDHIDVDDVLSWCRVHDTSVLQPGEADYPRPLEELDDTPPILFAQGSWLARDELSVAIVGTRHATAYGLQQTRRLALDLAHAGITIISGLARGVDTASHRAALEAGGRTIAVLGGGLGKLYPAENTDLAHSISKSGAVISEYAPLTQPRGGMFPQRNRLIAALGLATLVIEAPQRSGSLITARLASEMGRQVGALPGPVNSRASQGCHQLIRDGGTLVSNADEVLELLGPISRPIQSGGDHNRSQTESGVSSHNEEIRDGREVTLNEIERMVLNCVEPAGTAIDVITQQTELPPARVSAVISILEMKRFVRRLSSQYVSRV